MGTDGMTPTGRLKCIPHWAGSLEKNLYSLMVSYVCKEKICLELVADEYLGEIPDEAFRGISQVRK